MNTKLKMAGIALVVVAAFSAIVMVLWNALIPGIFGLTTINFWQAAGLAILSKMFFTS